MRKEFWAWMFGIALFAWSAAAQGYAITWHDSNDLPSNPPVMGMSSIGSMEYAEGYGWRDGMIDSFRPCYSDLYAFMLNPDPGESGNVSLYLEVTSTINLSDVRPERNAGFDGDEIFVGRLDLSIPNGINDINISRTFELYPEGQHTIFERFPLNVELGREYYLNMTSFFWGEMRNVEFAEDSPYPGHQVRSEYDYTVSADLAPVPEPSTLLLLGAGLAGLAGWRGKKSKR